MLKFLTSPDLTDENMSITSLKYTSVTQIILSLWIIFLIQVATINIYTTDDLMNTAVMRSLTFIIFMVSEKIAMVKFLQHTVIQTLGWPASGLTLIITYSHFSCESKKETFFSPN